MPTPARPPLPPAPPPAAAPFPSAPAAREAHAKLLAALPERPDPGDLGRVAEFIRRAVATGAVLDCPQDRQQVQGLVDYWTATLQTEYREAARAAGSGPARPASTVLAEFDKGYLRAAVDGAEAWLAGLPDDRQRLARRVVLRLIRLRATEPAFDLVTAPRGALQYQGPSPEAADEVIRRLTDLGVVRVTAGTTSENDQVAIRSAALLTDWASLVRWQRERIQFRDRARRWEADRAQTARVSVTRTIDRLDRWVTRKVGKFGRSVDKRLMPALRWLRHKSGLAIPSDALLTGDPLEEARAYHDRNPAERRLVDESREQQQLTSDFRKVLMGAFGLMLLVAVAGWVTVAGLGRLYYEKMIVAETRRVEAEGSLRMAERSLKMAEIRRSQAIELRQELDLAEVALAEVTGVALGLPDAKVWDESQRATLAARANQITDRQFQLRALRDPSRPLGPGCRVWIDAPTDGPTITSVCCVVQSAGNPARRFAVTYCSTVHRTKGPVAVYRTDLTGYAKDEGKYVGLIPQFIPTASSPNQMEAEWQQIALIELPSRVAADNVLPLGGGTLAGVADAAGGNVTLFGSSSGKRLGKLLPADGDVLWYGWREDRNGRFTTIGDAGGPVVDDQNRLVAVHMISELKRSKGCPLASWLRDNGLELVQPAAK